MNSTVQRAINPPIDSTNADPPMFSRSQEKYIETKTDSAAGFDYEADPLWRRKPLTPAQLLVHDICVEQLRANSPPQLEIIERTCSNLVPDNAARSHSSGPSLIAEATQNPIEAQTFTALEDSYGWIRHLRLPHDRPPTNPATATSTIPDTKCRWIHCSSKLPEYIPGFLWALSDDTEGIARSLRALKTCLTKETRHSLHGKYFDACFHVLQEEAETDLAYPLLAAVPFMDWGLQGETPPLRFQVDRREGFQSSRSSAHMLRSILQWYFRLEDTSDRERTQVFAKHRPWESDREQDLKVRQWYGHYPTRLNVDELWILAIDPQHIVTWSANQTWKARWPPLQLSSRITDVSFRSIRDAHLLHTTGYDALIHAITCLNGSVGMLHRSFWPDMVLSLTDRYVGRLGNLQYRLHRSPSTKLVMDLISCQEELSVVIQILEEQHAMITALQTRLSTLQSQHYERAARAIAHRDQLQSARTARQPDYSPSDPRLTTLDAAISATIAQTRRFDLLAPSAPLTSLTHPAGTLLENLARELTDLRALRARTDSLVTRTIQLVNLRLEDNGKVLLIFTLVTVLFLPLNFVAAFFGMNVADLRDMRQGQGLFWAVAVAVTVVVGGGSVVWAFRGAEWRERWHVWRLGRRTRARWWGGRGVVGMGRQRSL